jgi:thymidylate synthase (FAD)
MKVVPIAATTMFDHAVSEETPYQPHFMADTDVNPTHGFASVSDIDELAELAGRNCYLSWNRPNPKTASNEDYLANIIAQQHFSVMEHGSVTFYVTGVSRALLAELTRHRHLSFSVVSQRYVDANDLTFVIPPIVFDLPLADREWTKSDLGSWFEVKTLEFYNELVQVFVEHGFKRKQAREAARAVLPNMTDSPMVVTGNLRAWRDVLSKRYHVAADREIQQFAEEVLKHLRVLAPNCVQDIEGKYGDV